MSVINFSKQEMVNMMEAVKEQAHNGMYGIRHSILYSEAYMRKMRHEPDENKAVESLIEWMFDHLHKANLFAYVSQYGDPIEKGELDGEYPDKNKSYEATKLVGELNSLNYNLADNAGNMFVEPLYYKLLETITTALTRIYFESHTDESDRY